MRHAWPFPSSQASHKPVPHVWGQVLSHRRGKVQIPACDSWWQCLSLSLWVHSEKWINSQPNCLSWWLEWNLEVDPPRWSSRRLPFLKAHICDVCSPGFIYGYDLDPTTWKHRTESLSPFWLGPAWSEGLVATELGALAPYPANSGERLLQTHHAPLLSFSSELLPSPERLPHITLFGVISELGCWHWVSKYCFCFLVIQRPLFSTHSPSPPGTVCRVQRAWQMLSKQSERSIDWVSGWLIGWLTGTPCFLLRSQQCIPAGTGWWTMCFWGMGCTQLSLRDLFLQTTQLQDSHLHD